MDAEQEEMLLDFVSESLDMLDTVEPMVINLGKTDDLSEKTDTINTVFRLFHTLKGGAGFLNLDTIKEVTHTAENLLQLFRKDPTTLQVEYLDSLTKTCDLIRSMLEQVETQLHDQGFEDSARTMIQELEESIEAVAEGKPPTTFSSPSPTMESTMISSTEASEVGTAPSGPLQPEPSATSINASSEEDAVSQSPSPASEVKPPVAPEDIFEVDLDSLLLTPEMLHSFIQEADEQLESTEGALLVLDKIPGEVDTKEFIETAFRNMHTLKGNSSFLGLTQVETLSHKAENVLEQLKENNTTIRDSGIPILLKVIDTLRHGIQSVSSKQRLELPGYSNVLAQLTALSEGQPIPQFSEPAPSVVEAAPEPSAPEPQPEPTVSAAQQEVTTASPPPGEESQASQVSSEEVEKSTQAFEVDLSDLLLTPEMVQSFIQEAEEQLEGTEGALLVLAKLSDEVESNEFIETAFRNVHTLKGNSGFLGLAPVESLSHKAEAILEQMRSGNLEIAENAVQVLLQTIDCLRHGIASLAEKKKLLLPDYEAILNKLTQWEEGSFSEPSTPDPVSAPEPPLVEPRVATPAPPPTPKTPEPPPRPQMAVPTPTPKAPEPPPPPKPVVATPAPAAPPVVATPKANPAPAAPKETAAKPAKEKAAPAPVAKQNTNTQAAPPKRQDIRVSLDKVDLLINLVGELVISEAMVTNNPDLHDLNLERFVKAARQLNKNVRDLQEVAMSMRMLPISGTFRKMVRVVHDVSKKVGKNVELQLVGEETEVDRTVVEQIADPLLHIVRNAVDHGIDTPQERAAAGKPEMGTIVLEARHAGNEIWILISDDGRGLHRERILGRAKERGLVEPDADPPDSEVWKLIFAPGFSTAEKVTDLSGRGVGMDVVKRNIEKLRGRIDVSSVTGQGSEFLLRIPLTLAIIEGMLIRVGQSIYVVPIVAIRESLQPKQEHITTTTEGLELVRIREELIPVVRLHQLHHLVPTSTLLTEGILIVVEDDDRRLCLFVDEVVGERQVVVKGLPNYLGDVPHLAGCTILGDGGISLILDLASILNKQAA